MFAVLPIPTCCWICGKECRLEDCKIDKHGLRVHGECYERKTAPRRDRTPVERMTRTRAA